jgi:AraC-like DNA-binding protein
MRPETKQRYCEIAARHLIGEHAVEIAVVLGVSLRTVSRALSWYASQKANLTTEEELELAIASKQSLKKQAVERLNELRQGWCVMKTTAKGSEITEQTTERVFNPNAEVGMMRIMRDLDTDLTELRSLLRQVKEVAEQNNLVYDITISDPDDIEEEWMQKISGE